MGAIGWPNRVHFIVCVSFGRPRPAIPVSPSATSSSASRSSSIKPQMRVRAPEPTVPKEKRCYGCLLRRLYGIHLRGVISVGALTPIRFVAQCGDYATINLQALLRWHPSG